MSERHGSATASRIFRIPFVIFRLPALKSLHVVTEHLSPIAPPLGAFAEVIRASGSELHSLELSSRGVNGVDHLRSGDILELLRATLRLRHLCITVGTSRDSRVLQDTILPRLDPGGSNGDDVLVPVLESLELRFPSPSAILVVDLTALATAIRSRLSSSDSIRKLQFIVQSGNGSQDNGVLTSAIRTPIMEVLEGAEVDIVIKIRNTAKKV
ncbi:hypothetical protein L218DRAFT_1077706 [Marasmius fiardii PR-910]|nr:hypothetical protein L218DRAFT_1077706 [Marasmius fiardii PR-910]